MVFTVRKGSESDLGAALQLVKELAEFEREPDAVTASIKDYKNLYTDNLFDFLVAETAGKIVGVAIYYKTFSTWKGKMMYLEDLIVNESFRNHGIGQALFDNFLTESRLGGAKLVKWQVLHWNKHAIRFYVRNKAKIDSEWYNGVIYFN